MRLKDVIHLLLGEQDQTRVIYHGFKIPHLWKGNNNVLAFTPWSNTTIGEMIITARGALGSTIEGRLIAGDTECLISPTDQVTSPYSLDDTFTEIQFYVADCSYLHPRSRHDVSRRPTEWLHHPAGYRQGHDHG